MDLLYSILDSIAASIYWKDLNGRYLGCNSYMLKMSGLPNRESIIGKHDSELPWKSIAAQICEADQKVILEKASFELEEAPTIVSGETVVFLTTKTPLYNGSDVIGLIGVSQDITKRKNATEIALAMALTEAMKANAERETVLQRYQQFLNDQEHDIRTPVGGVVGGTEALISMIKEEPDAALEIAELMHLSAKEILDYQESLIYDLYAGIRPGRTIFSRFDLPDILKRIYNVNLMVASFKKLNFTYEYDECIPNYLIGDSKKVYQCLLDLVGNAIRFTHKGSVHLSAKYIRKEEDKVIVRFQVIDTGIGIPDDKQDEIYEAFVKVAPSNRGGERGRGLGLTRVNQLATVMKGELWFKSEVGKGSCFNLSLPFSVSIDQAS